MKTTLPMMVQDQALAGVSKLTEGFEVTTEPYFLDGPITERLAIIDFDEESGELLPGTPFFPLSPTKKAGRRGEYRISEEEKLGEKVGRKTEYFIESRHFNRVSVLATILKTISLFEDESVLGRRLSWAFDGPQLLVIPRAGEWANAFYQRETRSLQFFYFPRAKQSDDQETEMVYTSLSRDIVSHETAHAILDGIAPDLYHASTPQSLAFHEALADLTAVILSFKSRTLSDAVLRETGGEINKPSEFSSIAREFGLERSGSDALRELYQPEISLDEVGPEPHLLSVVLSSALYDFLLDHYSSWWETQYRKFKKKNDEKLAAGEPAPYEDPKFSSSGSALAIAVMEFERVILASLDFLPPGEVSFADYGRAIIAAQRNLIKDETVSKYKKKQAEQRISFLVKAFKDRGILVSQEAPLLQTEFNENPLDGVDLEDLINSDWIAYNFVNDNRELLSIPPHITFDVLPRFTARKRIQYSPALYQNQLFLKVRWTETEDIKIGRSGLPDKRRIVVGTTMVIDKDQGRPIAVLHTDHAEALRESRDQMLKMLIENDLLRMGSLAIGPHGEQLDGVIKAEETGGALELTGVANMLHVT
jgi:hypothetical protein